MQRHTVFASDTPKTIASDARSTITSQLAIDAKDQLVAHIAVAVDITHTWTGDLRIELISPGGGRVKLVADEGGSRDNFRFTIFDDRSSSTIAGASAPFRGVFSPKEPLGSLVGDDANGIWTLEVTDVFPEDGGTLNAWALAITTTEVQEPQALFEINVNFLGGLSQTQQQVFLAAAERWHEIINADSDGVGDGQVARLEIDASGVFIDGQHGTLGRAGPTRFRSGSRLPSRGIMEFDTGDLNAMERDGSLLNVIIHEMGHVIGIGTVWSRLGLLTGARTLNPEFHGAQAMGELAALTGGSANQPVPVANTGGQGTADAHWRENVFGQELMTGFLNGGVNPLSRLTVASLADLGYEVNLGAADGYVLPSSLARAMMGVAGGTTCRRDRCCIDIPEVG